MAIHKLKIFAGSGSHELAAKIAESYGCELGDLSVSRFSDGEFQPAFEESIRGCTVFIVQSTPPPAENLMELLLMIDAAKRASAYKVIAVIPYFGWARQDRKDRPRVSIGAKLVANLLVSAGVDRIITMQTRYRAFSTCRSITSMPAVFSCRTSSRSVWRTCR